MRHMGISSRKSKFATARLGAAAPLDLEGVDRLVRERTVFNAARTHRFTWFRHWGNPDDFVAGICMNPSGASESRADPTVAKMRKLAEEVLGAGAYYQLNALSIRGTYSNELGKADRINLPENDDWIRRIASKARFVIAAWGNPGEANGRGDELRDMLREICDTDRVLCFSINKNGAPAHPLYQSLKKPLVPYFPAFSRLSS